MSKKSTTVPITDKLLGSIVPRKTFNYHQGASITSLDFDDSGQYLISAGIDKNIQLYDVHKGIHTKEIQSQKYGAHLAKFTHKELNCLYVSTPEADNESCDHAIRYLSLSDKKYIRYFKGHKQQVTGLEVNPVHDTFISASYDNTVKVWDLRSPNPVGSLGTECPGLVAYDPYGIVFAVAQKQDKEGTISFYDTKNFYQKPFLVSTITTSCNWTHMEFSNTGKCVLLSTDSNEHYIIDAFSGNLLTKLVTGSSQYRSTYSISSTSCFSACGRYVLCGTANSTIQFFDLTTLKTSNGSETVSDGDNPKRLQPFKEINTNQGVPKLVAFDPKLLTVATADNSVTLWQPM